MPRGVLRAPRTAAPDRLKQVRARHGVTLTISIGGEGVDTGGGSEVRVACGRHPGDSALWIVAASPRQGGGQSCAPVMNAHKPDPEGLGAAGGGYQVTRRRGFTRLGTVGRFAMAEVTPWDSGPGRGAHTQAWCSSNVAAGP
jgi:hypothetical protein